MAMSCTPEQNVALMMRALRQPLHVGAACEAFLMLNYKYDPLSRQTYFSSPSKTSVTRISSIQSATSHTNTLTMSGGPFAQVVQDLINLLAVHGDSDKLDTATGQALAYDISDIAVLGSFDTPSFLKHANYLVTTWVPSEEKAGKDIYYDLVVFYFIFNQPAMKDLQNAISRGSSKKPLVYLSN